MCALYGSDRDASLVKKYNEEIIEDIIDTHVEYYKLALHHTKTNIYDEVSSAGKKYYHPLRIPCLIRRDDQEYQSDEFGQNYVANARFAFLRDTLVEKDLVVQVGDIVKWDNEYFEIDSTIKNEYWSGKNPNTEYRGNDFGYNVSILCDAHLTEVTKLNLIDMRTGLHD